METHAIAFLLGFAAGQNAALWRLDRMLKRLVRGLLKRSAR